MKQVPLNGIIGILLSVLFLQACDKNDTKSKNIISYYIDLQKVEIPVKKMGLGSIGVKYYEGSNFLDFRGYAENRSRMFFEIYKPFELNQPIAMKSRAACFRRNIADTNGFYQVVYNDSNSFWVIITSNSSSKISGTFQGICSNLTDTAIITKGYFDILKH